MKRLSLWKKVAVLGMVLTMVATSACHKSNESADTSKENQVTNEPSNEQSSDEKTTIDTSKHEVIKMIALGNKPTNGRLEEMLKQLNATLTEKVNAELTIQYVEWADWQTQYNVQLLSGDDSIDIITTGTDWLFTWQNAKKGAFLPLSEDMLATYAPQTWKQVEEKNDWDICKYDGDIYILPEDNFTQYTNKGMYYFGTWAKEAGLPNGEISKFEDLTTYFKYIKENKTNVIPWDVSGKNLAGGLAEFYFQSHSKDLPIDGVMAGNFYFWEVSQDDPYTVFAPMIEDDMMYDYAELMKEWNDMGVWREDVLNYDGDTRSEFIAGTSGSEHHHSMTFYSYVKPQADEKSPDLDAKMYAFGTENKNVVAPKKTHGAAAISANSKHPERALMVYDLLRNDEECYRLINYGIEGTDYIVTEDGKLDYPEGYDSSTDALGSNFWCGRNDDLELEPVTYWSGTKDMIANYNTYAFEYPFEQLPFDVSAVEAQQSAIASVLSEYVPQLAYGKFADPKAKVDEMREKVKMAGYDEVKAEIQRQIDEFKASQQ